MHNWVVNACRFVGLRFNSNSDFNFVIFERFYNCNSRPKVAMEKLNLDVIHYEILYTYINTANL